MLHLPFSPFSPSFPNMGHASVCKCDIDPEPIYERSEKRDKVEAFIDLLTSPMDLAYGPRRWTSVGAGRCRSVPPRLLAWHGPCMHGPYMLHAPWQAMNTALLKDIRSHYRNPNDPDSVAALDKDNPLLVETTKYLEATGIHDPLTKVELLPWL